MRGAVAVLLAPLLAGCTLLGTTAEPTPYYADLLAGDEFTDLVVEIDHAPGRRPSLLAQEHLLKELRNVTAKTRVSLLAQETLPDQPTKRWSAAELIELERQTRDTAHDAPVALLHVLYPAGEFEDAGVAGITISGTVLGPVAVFLDAIDEIDVGLGRLPQPSRARDEIERSTLLHEAGHAMGLVDNGLPMVRDHEDAAHEGHSRNPQSVMYWQVDSVDGLRQALLQDGTIPIHFDDDDRADMRAAGGR